MNVYIVGASLHELDVRMCKVEHGTELVNKLNMAKRKFEELDVSDLNAETSCATVHGAILELSPVKVSRKNRDVKYFEAKLTDGKKVARLVSFEPKLHKDLEKLKDSNESVSCVNCNVKKNWDGSQFEEVAVNKSTIRNSPKKFLISSQEKLQVSVTDLPELAGIEDLAVHGKVSIVGKIVSVTPVEEVKSKTNDKCFRKQECTIADKSCASRFVLWEELVEKVASVIRSLMWP